jgi:thiol-disulfide isomerase/thioredoxin
MPLFVETQQNYADRGVQFVGIAIDDPLMVQDFVDIYAINFPTLIGNADAIRLSNRMGNRFDSLPFTAIFDRQGNTRYIQVGELSREVLERELQPLL